MSGVALRASKDGVPRKGSKARRSKERVGKRADRARKLSKTSGEGEKASKHKESGKTSEVKSEINDVKSREKSGMKSGIKSGPKSHEKAEIKSEGKKDVKKGNTGESGEPESSTTASKAANRQTAAASDDKQRGMSPEGGSKSSPSSKAGVLSALKLARAISTNKVIEAHVRGNPLDMKSDMSSKKSKESKLTGKSKTGKNLWD